MNENILLRRADLADGVKNVLKDIPVVVDIENSAVTVRFHEMLVCGINVEDEAYKIYNVSAEWVDQTSYRCEKSGDDTWHYYLETIDECIGEINRMIRYVGNNEFSKNLSFKSQLEKYELNDPESWKGDPRNKLISMLQPLIDNTDYYFEVNKTDTSSKLIELHKKGINKRIMGFAGKQKMQIGAFFNHDFYVLIDKKIGLPENQRPNKTQEHVTISVEKLWNLFCAATDKSDFYV